MESLHTHTLASPQSVASLCFFIYVSGGVRACQTKTASVRKNIHSYILCLHKNPHHFPQGHHHVKETSGDVMLVVVGLNYRTPENEIERRTPSKSKYQDRFRYLHNEGSIHTENDKKPSSCISDLERKIITFLDLIKVVNST
jgi:hypothetical protein